MNNILYPKVIAFICGIAIPWSLMPGCKSGGNVTDGQVEISGTVMDKVTGSTLKDAIISNNRTGASALSDENGRFSMLCENGDSLTISYIGLIAQNIPVDSSDSTEWTVSMLEYGPIIEPALQKSYSTNDKLRMTVMNLDILKEPVDSIVVEIKNTSDKEATFGEWYRLERMEEDTWMKVPYNDRIRKLIEEDGVEMVFNDLGYIIPPHESRTYSNPTKAYNEKIIPGRYRLSKTFHYPPYPIEKSDTAYVEFEIP